VKRRDIIKLIGGSFYAAGSPSISGLSAPKPGTVQGPTGTVIHQLKPVLPRELAVSSAESVLTRLLGARAKEFHLDWVAPENGHILYEVTASGGTVSIRGSSGVAICRGAYAYLRETCNSMVTWSGKHLAPPAKFPDFPRQRVVCPYRFTQYYNVCTFGYSTPFWNWDRWERELDWMALHGITMPLALEGQEAIWTQVWIAMGLTEADLDRFSTGPAHLPWHRMGNIDYFDGPLPQGWMDQKRELQKKILTRMRELGMTPIVPAFSGHVPEGFKRVYPQARTYTLLWGGGFNGTMPRLAKTFFLDPRHNDLFMEIGRRFIQAYNREFGKNEYYLADPFNELNVPVSEEHRYEDLAHYGRVIHESIQAGDPDGKWALQAWLFQDVHFWDPRSVEAFLSQIPNDRTLIIDYGNDTREIWKSNKAYFGKPWIYGMIHTFGGNNNVKGALAFIDSKPAEVMASPEKGNLVGWGICPEGIETNEVVYELMTDIGWADHQIPLEAWLVDYSRARYGACFPEIRKAWKLLLQSAYGGDSYNSRHAWQCWPSLDPKPAGINEGPLFIQAVEHFIAPADELKSSELYCNDLIEFVAQSVGGSVDRRLAEACQAHNFGRSDVRDQKAQQSMEMLLRIDALMNLRKDRRLETWCDDARSWGRNAEEAAYYDSDGRLLITFWGWSELEDYASRVWSGLIRDYYVGRWRTFFQSLADKDTEAVMLWEQSWLSSPYSPSKPLHVEDLVSEAREMLQICRRWQSGAKA
jgi:alpha-N-acetylglucosaminidase